MPYNPSTSRAECNYHAGLVNQDSKNQPQTSNRESYNTFDKRHVVADTQLFDEVRPFYMNPANSGDVKRARMVNNDWSPVTKSQILSDIKKHRALFQVPWSVIMPNTWEYLFREPVQGSDLNWTNVGPVISKTTLISIISRILRPSELVTASDLTPSVYFEYIFKAAWLFNSMFGPSGLPQTLGVRIFSESVFESVTLSGSGQYDYSPSAFFSRLCNFMSSGVELTVSGSPKTYSISKTISYIPDVVKSPSGSTAAYTFTIGSASDAFNFLRDFIWYSKSDASLTISANGLSSSSDYAYLTAYLLKGETTFTIVPDFSSFAQPVFDRLADIDSSFYYNVMPLIAYQCIWHQFFTNDRIDAVYSAKMWQNNVLGFVVNNFIGTQSSRLIAFQLNGTYISYDAYSAYFMNVLAGLGGSSVTPAVIINVLDYFNELFSIRPSMRGSDYFTSMRTQPLAVGDVNVSVNSNLVSAIDINKSLWYQRFLNAVNRTKQSIYDYLQSITGVRPERVEPQPNFIVEEVFNLAGIQVDNNAESQGKIVSILRNSQSNYLYDIYVDEPSFVIGVDSYSVNYVYPDSCAKVSRISDRLDWFNDFMQHIGDQQVSLFELLTPTDLSTLDNPIGYQLRYAEFKNMLSRACGGFLSDDTDLSSWLILYSPASLGNVVLPQTSVISPYFIRNHASDFDRLFASLTGDNPANRFHVIKYTYVDEMDNSKQQAYPSLL